MEDNNKAEKQKEFIPKPKAKVEYAEKMKFLVYQKVDFKDAVIDPATNQQLMFVVQVNPDSISRSFTAKTVEDKKIRSANSSGEGAGFEAEQYSFDLIFDGTGALGVHTIGKANEYFQKFLKTVYANDTDQAVKKEASFVEIRYGKEIYRCKLSDLSAKYTLFGRNGDPMRIKASCTFISVDKDKPDGKPKNKGKTDVAPAVPAGSDPKELVNPQDTIEETEAKAEENNSPSLLCCCYCSTDLNK